MGERKAQNTKASAISFVVPPKLAENCATASSNTAPQFAEFIHDDWYPTQGLSTTQSVRPADGQLRAR